MKGTFEPGWRWSRDVKPIAGTDSCQTRHLGYTISGRMHITFDDGTEVEIAAGDAFDLAPGHDAYTVGDEPCVMIDVSPQATSYARGQTTTAPRRRTVICISYARAIRRSTPATSRR